jgi:hypothetical protein
MQHCRYPRKISLIRSRIISWYRHRLGWVPTVFWIICLALIVRLPKLLSPLWYDEVFSAGVATLPVDKLMIASAGDVHPPGYYLLLKAVIMALGRSDLALRIPSLLAGVTLLWLIYRLAGALRFTVPAQLTAVMIAALSPFQIYYSQEVRSYALVMAALTLAALGLVEHRRGWFIIGCVGALYLNTMSLFVIIGLGLAGLMTDRTKPFLISVATIGLLYIPAALMVVRQAGQLSAGYWILPPTSPGRLLSVADDLFFFSPKNPFIISSALCTSLAIILIAKRVNLSVLMNRPGVYLLLCAGLVPLCLASIVSMLWTPVLIYRSVAGCAPFLYLLTAWAVTQYRYTATFWLITATATAIAVWIGGSFTDNMGREGWPQPGSVAPQTFFYSSVGDYLPNSYYRPESAHYLLSADHTLSNDLTGQTKEALSIKSASPDIICSTGGLWTVNLTLTVLSTPADASIIADLQRKYAPYLVRSSKTEASETGIYNVPCGVVSDNF